MNRRVAVYAGTRNVYPHMVTAAKSLVSTTRMDRVVFLTEDKNFPEKLPGIVDVIDVSNQKWFEKTGPNYFSRWSYMSMMRLAVHELLPEEMRALWLDVDTIVRTDIGRLLDMNLDGYYMAAAEEPIRSRDPFVYYNSGVMLMNLEKLRDGMADALIGLVNTRRMRFPDQDAINLLCQTKIKKMDAQYNSNRWIVEVNDPAIIHYAADREYWTRSGWKKYENAEWRVKDAGKV